MKIVGVDHWEDFEAGTDLGAANNVSRWQNALSYRGPRMSNVFHDAWARELYHFSFGSTSGGNGRRIHSINGRNYLTFSKNNSNGLYSLKMAGLNTRVDTRNSALWKMGPSGKFIFGVWVYRNSSSYASYFQPRLRLLGGDTAGFHDFPNFSGNGDRFIELYWDTQTGIVEFRDNGAVVKSAVLDFQGVSRYEVGTDAAVVNGTNSTSTTSSIGPVMIAHGPPGDPDPLRTLAGMEIVPLSVGAGIDTQGWETSDPELGIVDVFNQPLASDLSNRDSPVAIASPDETPGKFTMTSADERVGRIQYVNIQARVGSAPARSDNVLTNTSLDGQTASAKITAVDENMQTVNVVDTATAPDGGQWTRANLEQTEVWVTAKAMDSPTPWPVGTTGPGPTALRAGDETLGFYGPTEVVDFIDDATLAALLGFTAGTEVSMGIWPWFKFSVDGKILFTPSGAFREGMTFNDIYEAGLAYAGNEAEMPVPTGAVQTDQNKTVTFGGYTYRVRLLRCITELPWDGNDVIADSDPNVLGEGSSLIYRLSNEWPVAADSWLGMNRNFLMAGGYADITLPLSTSSPNTAGMLRVDGLGRWRVSPVAVDATENLGLSLGWRPVLELVTD